LGATTLAVTGTGGCCGPFPQFGPLQGAEGESEDSRNRKGIAKAVWSSKAASIPWSEWLPDNQLPQPAEALLPVLRITAPIAASNANHLPKATPRGKWGWANASLNGCVHEEYIVINVSRAKGGVNFSGYTVIH
jgi:hypothetical protein